jgi:hypothetical protein
MTGSAAAADLPGGREIGAILDGDAAELLGDAQAPPGGSRGSAATKGGASQGATRAIGRGGEAAPEPYVYRLLPGCSGNTANGGGNDDCTATRAACPAGQLMFMVWRAPATNGAASGAFTQQGRQCMVPPHPADPADPAAPVVVELPGMTQADFQRLPLPAGEATVEPGDGDVLIRIPTNTYASAEPVELATTLVGFPVAVRATPVAYTWDYGDGTVVGPTEDAGAPWPDNTTGHVYEVPGVYAITLTTHYTGEYSVAGGPFLPIPGQATVTSEPADVVALAGTNELVADPLR